MASLSRATGIGRHFEKGKKSLPGAGGGGQAEVLLRQLRGGRLLRPPPPRRPPAPGRPWQEPEAAAAPRAATTCSGASRRSRGPSTRTWPKLTSSQLLNLITLEIFLQQETRAAELLFFSGNKRIKAVLILGENIMFTVPFKVMNQSLTI